MPARLNRKTVGLMDRQQTGMVPWPFSAAISSGILTLSPETADRPVDFELPDKASSGMKKRTMFETLEPRQFLDATLLNFAVNDIAFYEGNTGTLSAQFTVVLGGLSATQTAQVSYRTVDDSAKAGEDYGAVSGSLFFGPGVRTKTIIIPIYGDTIIEASERFFLDLSNPVSATISRGRGVATIADDDKPQLSISSPDSSSSESPGNPGVFRIVRTGSRSQALKVKYNVLGTATNGVDYSVLTGTVTIPKSKSSVEFSLNPISDIEQEPTETVVLRLRTSTDYTLSTATQATVTILNREIVPPTASLTAYSWKTAGTRPYQFTVVYSDNVAVNANTIGAADLRVTGPNGYDVLAQLYSKTVSSDGKTVTAVYRAPAPGGSWDPADNGLYTISMLSGAIADRAGNTIAPGALGTFRVTIA